MNAVMERRVQTCRHELLDRTLIWNQRHLLHALREFEAFTLTCPDGILGRRRDAAANLAGVATAPSPARPGQLDAQVIGQLPAHDPAGVGVQYERYTYTSW